MSCVSLTALLYDSLLVLIPQSRLEYSVFLYILHSVLLYSVYMYIVFIYTMFP